MREDQAKITCVLERKEGGNWVPWPNTDWLAAIIWENRTGGGAGSESTKHRPGNMGDQESLGGPQTLENVTIERRYDGTTLGPQRYKILKEARGRGRLTITEQQLDEFAVAFGDAISFQGKLVGVNLGGPNANSNGVRMLSLECETAVIS